MLNKILYTLTFSIALMVLDINPIQANDEIQLYSYAGYPYKNLIKKTKAVKILFTENNEHVYCRIQVEWSTQHKTTDRVQVTKKQFEQTPLKSCLPRKVAKTLLSSIVFDYL